MHYLSTITTQQSYTPSENLQFQFNPSMWLVEQHHSLVVVSRGLSVAKARELVDGERRMREATR